MVPRNRAVTVEQLTVCPMRPFSLKYFRTPAMARAPAGSITHRVSLNPSLMAY